MCGVLIKQNAKISYQIVIAKYRDKARECWDVEITANPWSKRKLRDEPGNNLRKVKDKITGIREGLLEGQEDLGDVTYIKFSYIKTA